jgi:hypothetical protein
MRDLTASRKKSIRTATVTSQLPKLPDSELPMRTTRLEMRMISKDDAFAMFEVLAGFYLS